MLPEFILSWTQNSDVTAINRSKGCRNNNIVMLPCKNPGFWLHQVCQLDDKQTTFKMLVPWMEFGSLMLSWDIFPGSPTSSLTFLHASFFFSPSQYKCAIEIKSVKVNANRHLVHINSNLSLFKDFVYYVDKQTIHFTFGLTAPLRLCQCERFIRLGLTAPFGGSKEDPKDAFSLGLNHNCLSGMWWVWDWQRSTTSLHIKRHMSHIHCSDWL